MGKTAPRHTSEQFVAFLTDIEASQPERQEIHVICDNVSSHKTKRVEEFLAAHRNVQMHFTPTYSSWLNQVENWFSRIQRDVISRGIFTSVKDLGKKLMRYIREHNKDPRPIKWKYDDPSRRIRPVPCCFQLEGHGTAPVLGAAIRWIREFLEAVRALLPET